MYSPEKSVGGNDRHCPLETSFRARMRVCEQGGGGGRGWWGWGLCAGVDGGVPGKAEEAAKDGYANARV